MGHPWWLLPHYHSLLEVLTSDVDMLLTSHEGHEVPSLLGV